MNRKSVLFVIDGEEPVRRSLQRSLERAVMLARTLRARLDLLLWKDWSSYTAKLQPGGTEAGMRYLHELRNSILCHDVDITMRATFGGTLPTVIDEQVKQRNCALVVKVRRHGLARHGSSVDRDLMRLCAVPLLLTDGRPWAPRPRLAAAVSALDEDSAIDRAVIQTAAVLQRACAAHIDLVYAQPINALSEAIEGESPAQLLLRQRAHSCHVEPQSVHVLDGQVNRVLPPFVDAMHYDLLAIGGPNEENSALWGFTASSQVDALLRITCDLLIVSDSHPATALASAEHLPREAESLQSAAG
jgi:nucleotide-binding universal stress UspA family protein